MPISRILPESFRTSRMSRPAPVYVTKNTLVVAGQLYTLGPESLNLGSLQRENKTASSSTRDTEGTGYLSKFYMVPNEPRKSRRPGG